MFGVSRYERVARRELTILMGIVAILGLSLLAPARAHASGCTDSWKNAESGSWFTASNWSTGSVPSSSDDACITVEGTYTVTMAQTNLTSTVSVHSLTVGAASGTQTLAVESSCTLNATLTTTAGITNGAKGAITLTNGDGCSESVTVASAIANAGSILSEPAIGGGRSLQGNLVNTGTLTINTNTAYSGEGAALTNEGAISVAEGKQLTVSNKGSVTNGAGGSITGTGTGNLLAGSGTTFTEGAGTTVGTEPVIVDDSTLDYNPSGGKGTISLHGSSALNGSSSSGQTLLIQSTCTEHNVTTAATGFSNGGKIALTNGDNCSNNVTLILTSGTLANSGTLVSELAHGGSRTIQGNFTNTGTFELSANTAYSGAGALLTNEGAINIVEGKQLNVSNKGSVTNSAGGSISAGPGGNVTMGSGTTFTEGAGTTNGNKPVIVDDATLAYVAGGGKGPIALRGTSSLSGKIVFGQTLSIESTCSEHATTTAAEGVKNGGTITLTNADGCSNNATLSIPSGTLINSGKIVTEPAVGGSRTIQGSITNTGTIAINANTTYNSSTALLTNEGSIVLAENKQLSLSSGSSFTNGAGGKITANPGSDVFQLGGTFTQEKGTTAGTKPVIVDDAALHYSGEGESRIAIRGSSTLSGNISAVQSLTLESTCSEHVTVTASTSYINAGTITLTNGDGCSDNATLAISSGTLTNSNLIISQPAIGGSRTLEGNITNTGTITLNANTSDPALGAILVNEGAINVANGASFSLAKGATVTNGSGGTIAGTGSGALVQTSGTFNQGLGATTGNQPVVLDDLTLNYSEHGSGKVALRGTSSLSGTVRADETLAIQSTCGEHATVTAAGSFNSNGTLELTNGDGCSNNATLNLKGGTLTNNGTLVVANPHGGARKIEGNLVNNLILSLAAGQTLQVSGTYTQAAAGKLRTFIAGASSFGALSVSGGASINGTLTLRQVEPFKATLGQTYAILSSSALTGTFATETEGQIDFTGLYYKPTYSASGMTLVVTQATQTRTPNGGAPGSTVTLTGSGYPAGDTITPTFTDHSGTKTVYPGVTVNGSGEFSAEITIPPTAALGAGTINTTSTLTGVHINSTFKVL